ncbi:unnamed protein product [Sphagnum jensenii]|uniref:Uncharacterized protein n=1 Tax=Sphagnum jensenii TaxID=128206 RepID=A0ABP0XA18_9BRYO
MILAWYRLTQMLVPTHTNLFIFEIEQEWQNWVGWSWARLHCHFFWLRGLRQQHYKSLDMEGFIQCAGLPKIVAFTPACKHLGCLTRFRGEKTVDALVEWAATSLLKLPRILYYGAKGLMTDVIQKTGLHKVKVIVFSNTGERAAPYIRQAAKQYWDYAVFAMVLWQEQSNTFWETRVGVKSAPAVVFVKDPGLEPVIYHGMNCLPSLPLLIL